MSKPQKLVASALVASFASVLPAMAVASPESAMPACGGDKGDKDGKEVKKPHPDDDKKRPNPA